MNLTTSPSGGRGCGQRKAGGLYLATGTSEEGVPIWELLIDPPQLYVLDWFRSIKIVDDLITFGDEEVCVLLHWVGSTYYPTIPHYVEEGRRYGFSTRVSEQFDWSVTEGRKVMLVSIHPRAIPGWKEDDSVIRALKGERTSPIPVRMSFRYCKHCGPWPPTEPHYAEKGESDTRPFADHYPNCIYHNWPLAIDVVDDKERIGRDTPIPDDEDGLVEEQTLISSPWGLWDPLHVIDNYLMLGTPDSAALSHQLQRLVRRYPDYEYLPGMFMYRLVTHIEAIEYVPEAANVNEGSLPVAVVDR